MVLPSGYSSDKVDVLKRWRVTVHPDTIAHVRALGADPKRYAEFAQITRDLLSVGVSKPYLLAEVGVYVCRNEHVVMESDLVASRGSGHARCPHCRRENNRRYYYAESRYALTRP